MSTATANQMAAVRELTIDEIDLVSGGEITVVAEKGYVGIEISIGGYGVAVWVTEGSLCGQVTTPGLGTVGVGAATTTGGTAGFGAGSNTGGTTASFGSTSRIA